MAKKSTRQIKQAFEEKVHILWSFSLKLSTWLFVRDNTIFTSNLVAKVFVIKIQISVLHIKVSSSFSTFLSLSKNLPSELSKLSSFTLTMNRCDVKPLKYFNFPGYLPARENLISVATVLEDT